ncbi:dihydrolipoamide acetyltransferase family protein [Actinoallomurus sp. CA-150999]|uniref:dihydrolipoamide acetyltransferase family protein n=1 Tax=Actinoallomurus sp. CA-150999 TaxID=3239887 RepID=UPI003D8D42F2
MSEVVFRLPDLGEGLTEAEITEWRVSPGDTVTVDQNVLEVETAKAAVDVPIPIAGTVARLYGEVGSVIGVGEPLIAVTVAGQAAAPEPDTAPSARDERYREEERAGSGNVLVGYGTGTARRSRRRRAGRTGPVPPRRATGPVPGSPVSVVGGQVSAAPPSSAARPVPAAPPSSAARPVPGASASAPNGPVLAASDLTAAAPASPAPSVPAARAEAPRVISPVVRQLARAHAIDIGALTPSGPGGVVLRRDVDAAIAAAPSEAAPTAAARSASASGPAVALETADKETSVRASREAPFRADQEAARADREAPVRIPLRGVRRTVAEKLSRSRREIPDASTWVDVDATPLVELKADLDRALPDARIGMLALFARICVAGLRRFPELNAYVDTERQEIVQVPQVHLGFAAQTDRGLVVPVVPDAHRLTLAELAARLRERTEDARAGRLAPQDLTGGTFTLNNYGVFGVDGSNPIINHPEAAMLGVGRIIDRPWAYEGEIRLRKVTQLSFTFDHRVCDGGVAGGFLRFVADCVERPALLAAHL